MKLFVKVRIDAHPHPSHWPRYLVPGTLYAPRRLPWPKGWPVPCLVRLDRKTDGTLDVRVQ